MLNERELWSAFEQFSPGTREDVRQFFAPGRVNLIGEHTDYNGGYVFPAALTLGVWAFVRPRQDEVLRFYSVDFPTVIECVGRPLANDPKDDYANYAKGVIDAIEQETGKTCPGADFFYFSNLPNGAGLSSSAALELVTACAVRSMINAALDNSRLAVLSQRAENQFVGVNCGIMDQFASAMGKKDHAIFLKCDTLDYKLVPFVLSDYALVVTNTNKRRGLTDSKYNERRQECDEALAIIQKQFPNVTCLADVPNSELPAIESLLEDHPVLLKRARHVITENDRTEMAVQVLQSGNLEQFGKLMNASHASLRDDYEVTGLELDTLAQAALEVDGCIGSRMTGAGFGGCTVSLVQHSALAAFEQHVGHRYTAVTGLVPSFYVSEIGDGAHELRKEAYIK